MLNPRVKLNQSQTAEKARLNDRAVVFRTETALGEGNRENMHTHICTHLYPFIPTAKEKKQEAFSFLESTEFPRYVPGECTPQNTSTKYVTSPLIHNVLPTSLVQTFAH